MPIRRIRAKRLPDPVPGKGHYTTFTEVLKKLFSGKGETSYDTGNVSYTYRTTDKVNTTPVSKETVTTTRRPCGLQLYLH